MARKTVEFFRKTYVLDSAGITIVDVSAENQPEGLIYGYRVRLKCSALSSFDSAVADYPKVLRSITYGANRPKFNVMTAVPGKFWDKVWTSLQRKATSRTTPTANGFDIDYYLPFAWPGTDRFKAHRPKDTALLNVKGKAQPFLCLHLGPYSDVAITLDAAPTVAVIVEADYDPEVRPGLENQIDPMKSGDQPGRMLEVSVKQKSDLSVNPEIVLLSGGKRHNIGVLARELDNTGAEVSDIFTGGIATPSKFEIVRGDSDGYTPRVKVDSLDARMSDEFGIAVQAGYHYWLAARDGKLMKALDIDNGQTFKLALDNLATTASRVLEIMQIGTIEFGPDVMAEYAALLSGK